MACCHSLCKSYGWEIKQFDLGCKFSPTVTPHCSWLCRMKQNSTFQIMLFRCSFESVLTITKTGQLWNLWAPLACKNCYFFPSKWKTYFFPPSWTEASEFLKLCNAWRAWIPWIPNNSQSAEQVLRFRNMQILMDEDFFLR